MRVTNKLRTYVVCSKSKNCLFSFSVSFINMMLKSSISKSSSEIDTHSYVETISSIKRVLFHVIWFEHLESYMTLKQRRFFWFWFNIVFAKETRALSTSDNSKTLSLSRSRSSRLLSFFLLSWSLLSRCRLSRDSSDSRILNRISNVATRWTYQKSLKWDSSFCRIWSRFFLLTFHSKLRDSTIRNEQFFHACVSSHRHSKFSYLLSLMSAKVKAKDFCFWSEVEFVKCWRRLITTSFFNSIRYSLMISKKSRERREVFCNFVHVSQKKKLKFVRSSENAECICARYKLNRSSVRSSFF
jgi:hypothetical protein